MCSSKSVARGRKAIVYPPPPQSHNGLSYLNNLRNFMKKSHFLIPYSWLVDFLNLPYDVFFVLLIAVLNCTITFKNLSVCAVILKPLHLSCIKCNYFELKFQKSPTVRGFSTNSSLQTLRSWALPRLRKLKALHARPDLYLD